MQTLSKGYYKPAVNDPSEGAAGTGWFESHRSNWQRVNDHDHDGINSQAISTAGLQKLTSTILVADWVNDGGGNYHCDITVPAAISGAVAPLNDITYYMLKLMETATGNPVALTWTRLTATTFRVETNNNVDVTILYV